jgi:hypothetical protein
LVEVQVVPSRLLAAVRRDLSPGEVGAAWRPALDAVWTVLRSRPGAWSGGHNVFVYRPSGVRLVCDFGVEVTQPFEVTGDVRPVETPAGTAAVAVHRGGYDRLAETHRAMSEWLAGNGFAATGVSWEVYGDPTPDPAETETTVFHLLRD